MFAKLFHFSDKKLIGFDHNIILIHPEVIFVFKKNLVVYLYNQNRKKNINEHTYMYKYIMKRFKSMGGGHLCNFERYIFY